MQQILTPILGIGIAYFYMTKTQFVFICNPTFFVHPDFIDKKGAELSHCLAKNPDFGHKKRFVGVSHISTISERIAEKKNCPDVVPYLSKLNCLCVYGMAYAYRRDIIELLHTGRPR